MDLIYRGPPMTHISPTMLNVCQVWTQHKVKIINTQNIIFCVFYFHSTTHPSIKLRLHHLHYYQSLERKKLWHKKYIYGLDTKSQWEHSKLRQSHRSSKRNIYIPWMRTRLWKYLNGNIQMQKGAKAKRIRWEETCNSVLDTNY